MGWNVPDDWGCYYSNCSICGSRYHASEGGCGCTDDAVQCTGCLNTHRMHREREHCYFDESEVVEIGGLYYCESHACCDGCGEKHDDHPVTPFEGDLYCDECMKEITEAV